MTVRKTITVPAAGSTESFLVAGSQVVVEKTPDNTPAGVPILRLDTPNGNGLPAFNQARYTLDGGFQRIYVEGTAASAGGTLYLLVITDERLQFRISGAVA